MEPEQLFRIHLENTRALDDAFKITSRLCKDAIRRQSPHEVEALTRSCGFLLGAKLENRLYRLIYEESLFSSEHRSRIMKELSIQDQWLRVIREAFAARRGIAPEKVPDHLGFSDRAKYDELVRLVNDELAPFITLRNVLAHGQWHRALDPDRAGVSTERMRLLKIHSLWRLTIKTNMLNHLVYLIHDLVVTKSAFDRDFDRHWRDLQDAWRRLTSDRTDAWNNQLIARYQRGNHAARGAQKP